MRAAKPGPRSLKDKCPRERPEQVVCAQEVEQTSWAGQRGHKAGWGRAEGRRVGAGAALAEATTHRAHQQTPPPPYRPVFTGGARAAVEMCLGRERSLPLPSSNVTI